MRDMAARDGGGRRAAKHKRRACRCRRQNAQHVAVIGVCNLYSLTKGQQAIRELARAMSDRTGNLPLLPGIYPDYRAPIVRNQAEGRELTMARWGMPSPMSALKGALRIYATSNHRIGGGGSTSSTAAWCRSRVSARMKPCRTARSHRYGSHSMRHGLSPSL